MPNTMIRARPIAPAIFAFILNEMGCQTGKPVNEWNFVHLPGQPDLLYWDLKSSRTAHEQAVLQADESYFDHYTYENATAYCKRVFRAQLYIIRMSIEGGYRTWQNWQDLLMDRVTISAVVGSHFMSMNVEHRSRANIVRESVIRCAFHSSPVALKRYMDFGICAAARQLIAMLETTPAPPDGNDRSGLPLFAMRPFPALSIPRKVPKKGEYETAKTIRHERELTGREQWFEDFLAIRDEVWTSMASYSEAARPSAVANVYTTHQLEYAVKALFTRSIRKAGHAGLSSLGLEQKARILSDTLAALNAEEGGTSLSRHTIFHYLTDQEIVAYNAATAASSSRAKAHFGLREARGQCRAGKCEERAVEPIQSPRYCHDHQSVRNTFFRSKESFLIKQRARRAARREGIRSDDAILELFHLFSDLLIDQRNCCDYCGRKVRTYSIVTVHEISVAKQLDLAQTDRVSFDRVVPAVHNGSYFQKGNVRAVCAGCQAGKYWFKLEEFYILADEIARAPLRISRNGRWLQTVAEEQVVAVSDEDRQTYLIPWANQVAVNVIRSEEIASRQRRTKIKTSTLLRSEIVALAETVWAGNGFVWDLTGARVPLVLCGLDRRDPEVPYCSSNVRVALGCVNLVRSFSPDDQRIIDWKGALAASAKVKEKAAEARKNGFTMPLYNHTPTRKSFANDLQNATALFRSGLLDDLAQEIMHDWQTDEQTARGEEEEAEGDEAEGEEEEEADEAGDGRGGFDDDGQTISSRQRGKRRRLD